MSVNPLEYHVPRLGKVTARLYDFAGQTYKLLENEGHIGRMKEIDQLGVIRNVYEGAHHSRWEYVMLQLSMIYKLTILKDEEGKKFGSGLGLSAKGVNFNGKEPTGADILQMWTLLFNAGHLPGTFATQRGLLRCCQKDSGIRRTIYMGLRTKKMRDYFREKCESDDIYSFHKILSHFHLARYRKREPELIDFLLKVMDFYNFYSNKNTEKQENLRYLFQRIRQISYLFLDSQYGPVPVYFDLSEIFFNFPDYIPVLFKEHDNPIIRTLDSFEYLLSINLYHSASCIRELGNHSKKIEQKIIEDKEEKELKKVTSLQNYLMEDYMIFQPRQGKWNNAPNIHLLFEFPYISFANSFKNKFSYKVEEEVNKRYNERYCQLTTQISPTKKQMAITLSFFPSSTLKRNIRIIGSFLKDVINLNNGLKTDISEKHGFLEEDVNNIFQKPYKDLITSILNYTTPKEISFEFKSDELKMPILPAKGSKIGAKKIKNILKNFSSSSKRYHELKTLSEALNDLNHPSKLLLCLSQISVYDNEEGRELTDIDGFGISFKNNNLGVLLVEAKDQKKGTFTKSKKQLEENINNKSQFKTSRKPSVTKIDGGAYCYLIIDG